MQSSSFPLRFEPETPDPLPVLVTIPHYGVHALPDFEVSDYAEPEFEHFAHGFADPFAANIYGELHREGATVLASPFSRLFVDLNRARDDFDCEEGTVSSNRGVVRTHTLSGRAVFKEELATDHIEERLQAFYDPYHDALGEALDELLALHERIVLLDAHTALSPRFGDHQVIVSTQRGRTAAKELAHELGNAFAEQGFRVDYDVSGYAGGHTVRTYGRTANEAVEAIQVEVGLTTLLDTPRLDFIDAIKRGERPQPCPERLGRVQAALAQALPTLASAL